MRINELLMLVNRTHNILCLMLCVLLTYKVLLTTMTRPFSVNFGHLCLIITILVTCYCTDFKKHLYSSILSK